MSSELLEHCTRWFVFLLFNFLGEVPLPHRLSLPDNAQVSVIALGRISHPRTDLYAVAG
jgi:hypothetical protein